MIRFIEFHDVKFGGSTVYAVDALNVFLKINKLDVEIQDVRYHPGSVLVQLALNPTVELHTPGGRFGECVRGLCYQEYGGS